MTGPEKSYRLVHDDEAIVELALLRRTVDYLREKARQNHKMHESSWNEGGNGDFVTCTRTDCTEAREYLVAWGADL